MIEVARGYFDEAALERVHQRLQAMLAAELHLDAIYVCPHGPDDPSDCRSRRAGLRAACLRLVHRTRNEDLGMHLITGGAGFIGSNIAVALDAEGADIVISDCIGSDDFKVACCALVRSGPG